MMCRSSGKTQISTHMQLNIYTTNALMYFAKKWLGRLETPLQYRILAGHVTTWLSTDYISSQWDVSQYDANKSHSKRPVDLKNKVFPLNEKIDVVYHGVLDTFNITFCCGVMLQPIELLLKACFSVRTGFKNKFLNETDHNLVNLSVLSCDQPWKNKDNLRQCSVNFNSCKSNSKLDPQSEVGIFKLFCLG